MLKRRYLVLCAALQSACSFVLDFDKLSKRGELDAATGCACDDDDPCTTDSCTEDGGCSNVPVECDPMDSCHQTACKAGECVQTPIEGLIADEPMPPLDLAGDFIFRSAVEANADRFFIATYGTFRGVRDIVLQSFAVDADEAAPVQEIQLSQELEDQGISGAIVSPPALALDSRLANLYFATVPEGAPAQTAGQMYRARFDIKNLEFYDVQKITDSPNYRVITEFVGPAAGTASDLPFVVWPGCTIDSSGPQSSCFTSEYEGSDGGIYLQWGDKEVEPGDSTRFFPEHQPIAAIAALGQGSARGAAWLTASEAGTLEQVRAAFLGAAGSSLQLQQCSLLDQGRSYALSTTSLPDGSAHLLGWAQKTPTATEAELGLLACNGGTCTDYGLLTDPDCEGEARLLPDARNLDLAVFQTEQAPGETYLATAFAVTQNNGSALGVSLSSLRVTASEDAGAAWESEPTVLSSTAAGTPEDWPAITVGGDRLLVAWTASDGSGGQKRFVARQRICVPQ